MLAAAFPVPSAGLGVSDVDDPFVGSASADLAGSKDSDPAVGTPTVYPAAASARLVQYMYCDLADSDFTGMERALAEAPEGTDLGEFFADQLEGCLLPLDPIVSHLVGMAIHHSRNGVLRLLLQRMVFPGQAEKDAAFGAALTVALHHSNFEAAAVLLSQMATVPNYRELWVPPSGDARPWDMQRIRAFIIEHAGRVAELVPRWENMALVHSALDALQLIELARFCDAFLRPKEELGLFDSTWFLYALLLPSTVMPDADKAVVARRLIEAGASVDEYAASCHGPGRIGFEATCEVLLEAAAPSL
jgi:hypothetical protein